MNVIIYGVFGLLGFMIIIGIIWRFLSQRSTLPCPTWLAWMVEMDNPLTKTNRAATIIKDLEIQPGMVVLDAGCGPGRLTIPIATSVGPTGEVVAMDIQAGMLHRTQEKAQAANLINIKFLQAGLGEGKLEHNTCDRALLVTVLGEIPKSAQMAALKEIFDALKPGGLLSVTELVFDPHFQRRGVVLLLAHSVGFQEKNFFGNWWAYTIHLEKPVR